MEKLRFFLLLSFTDLRRGAPSPLSSPLLSSHLSLFLSLILYWKIHNLSSSSALPFSPLAIYLSVEPTNQVVTVDKLQTWRTRTGGTAMVDNRRRRRRIQTSESVLL
ncbi:hypothetical protein ACFX2H_045128 [Malus domestica]